MDELQNKSLKIHKTKIPGLLIIDLLVNGDERGWFKETFQKEKLEQLGFQKDFQIVQMNASYNKERGVTRGIHAEPWNKYSAVQYGEVFAAIVDLRDGPTFGMTETVHLNHERAIFVPKGCGNSYQTLTPDVVYTYLVDDHWSPETKYTLINLADPALNIQWPIPLDQAILSEKDKSHPFLDKIQPIKFEKRGKK